MPNFYLDNPDILFHMRTMDISRIIKLKEDDFKEAETYPDAPSSLEDAQDNCRRVLEIIGDIAGEFIAPRARDVDREGARFENGSVTYAGGTAEALDRLRKADLMGFTLPRRFGGTNLPKTVYAVATEIISRADASLMNLFGLQEIAETILKFGSEDQKRRYLPRFASGEVMGSMALTEPDAGSDLQSISLKADQNGEGVWKLNGVKRFITNGCARIALVMARSEAGTTGGRGISLFIYERDENMRIRRIENKMGIHGSPTCELQFNEARAELLGKRKHGLVKYTMSLMNGARMGIAAQAVGIAEAAYREAERYASDRIQFKKPIREFSAISEMLTDMKSSIEAGRSLLYESSRIVDLMDAIEEAVREHPERAEDHKVELGRLSRYASLMTPITKAYTTEMVNAVCYDALQIHGGVGFTTEFDVERYYRDARITNIYEGTTQMQVLAALGGILTGVLFERLNDYEEADMSSIPEIFESARDCRLHLESVTALIRERKDPDFQEYHARRTFDMAADTLLAYLLCLDALKSERKKSVARHFIRKAALRVRANRDAVMNDDGLFKEDSRAVLTAGQDLTDSDEAV